MLCVHKFHFLLLQVGHLLLVPLLAHCAMMQIVSNQNLLLFKYTSVSLRNINLQLYWYDMYLRTQLKL